MVGVDSRKAFRGRVDLLELLRIHRTPSIQTKPKVSPKTHQDSQTRQEDHPPSTHHWEIKVHFQVSLKIPAISPLFKIQANLHFQAINHFKALHSPSQILQTQTFNQVSFNPSLQVFPRIFHQTHLNQSRTFQAL
jgi:hypothetical protein